MRGAIGWSAVIVGLAMGGCGGASSGGGASRPPLVVMIPESTANPLPDPRPPPSCVDGDLVSPERVCGLGVAGRGYRWNDPRIRALAARRAARNLAGMLRSLVTSALVLEQDEDDRYWSRRERYIEIDDALVARIEGAADTDVWFDVLGEGPFRQAERTYACACLSTVEAGMRIDRRQAEHHAFARQFAVDEVPRWLADAELQNEALQCAIGYHATMFHPEDMLGPLTESVREQLVGRTRTWVLSEFDERTVCGRQAGSPALDGCRTDLDSLVEAANEGVSRGVALTAVWFDSLGIGPNAKKMSAYGWGCVFDEAVLDAARRRLDEIRSRPLPLSIEAAPSASAEGAIRPHEDQGTSNEAPVVARASSAR